MATLLPSIQNTYWQISTAGCGNVVEGVEDVRQCLDILLRTQIGSDPLRPQFGTDIYSHLDKPVNSVIPNVKKEIIAAVALWEKRVSIVSITHTTNVSNTQLFITYKLVDDDLIDQVSLYMANGGFVVTPAQATRLIVEAAIPNDGNNLLLYFSKDGASVLPAPPVYGFETPAEMYAWCIANWGYLGNWYLLPERLICYMFPAIAVTASLTIESINIYRYRAYIPVPAVGGAIVANFTPENATGFTYSTPPVYTLAALLASVNELFSEYGSWEIEVQNYFGDFNALDFNNMDFNVVSNGYYLTLYSYSNGNATLTVTTV